MHAILQALEVLMRTGKQRLPIIAESGLVSTLSDVERMYPKMSAFLLENPSTSGQRLREERQKSLHIPLVWRLVSIRPARGTGNLV
jgi:hypothetical protein